MPQNPVSGKSLKNNEKKEYQFYNEKKSMWQSCRWKWFIEQRKRGVKTRCRLPTDENWTDMPQLFEDKRADNNPEAGPGRRLKYGEPTRQINVPESLIASLEKKMARLEKKAQKEFKR